MIPLDYSGMFYYVAQYKSFTRAAEYLNNSQPNLTRCMNILENELGCPLFIRSNRGVTLTPEGDKLYHYVSVGYEQILTGEQKIRKTKDMEEGMITIGVSDIALHLILLDRLEEFHETYPSIRLQILSDSAPAAIDFLRNHLVDFSVVTTPINIKKPLIKTSLRTFHEILIGGIKYSSYAAYLMYNKNAYTYKEYPTYCMFRYNNWYVKNKDKFPYWSEYGKNEFEEIFEFINEVVNN